MFKALGIATTAVGQRGWIELPNDVKLLGAWTIVTASHAALLYALGISVFTVFFTVRQACFGGGKLVYYRRKTTYWTNSKLMGGFKSVRGVCFTT